MLINPEGMNAPNQKFVFLWPTLQPRQTERQTDRHTHTHTHTLTHTLISFHLTQNSRAILLSRPPNSPLIQSCSLKRNPKLIYTKV